MVIAAVTRVALQEVQLLDETNRGSAGFGSSGVR
jgi:dUTPase